MHNYFKFLNLKNSDEIKKKFILKYEISDKEIIIFFADNTKYKVEYTNDNEIKILKRMKEQIKQYKQIFDEQFINNRIKHFDEFVYLLLVVLFFGFSLFMIGHGEIIANIIGLTLTFLGVIVLGGKCLMNIFNKKVIDDYKKTILFLENEVFINQKINSRDCENIFSNVNDNIKDACPVKSNGKIEVTINTIDKLSLRELKLLLENIKKETYIMNDNSFSDLNNKESVKKLKK